MKIFIFSLKIKQYIALFGHYFLMMGWLKFRSCHASGIQFMMFCEFVTLACLCSQTRKLNQLRLILGMILHWVTNEASNTINTALFCNSYIFLYQLYCCIYSFASMFEVSAAMYADSLGFKEVFWCTNMGTSFRAFLLLLIHSYEILWLFCSSILSIIELFQNYGCYFSKKGRRVSL